MARASIGLAGLLVASLAGCGGSPSPSSSPAASVAAQATVSPSAAAPTAGPTASPAAAHGWRVVSTRSELGPGHLRDVTSFRGSLVAVGATDTALGVIWSSADGRAWKSIAGTTKLDGMLLNAIAAGDPGLVVVGWSETDAIVLFSPDGISWERPALPSSHPGSSAMSVTWHQGRFVAVGGGGEPGAAVSWISEDGRTWTRISIFLEGDQAALMSVAAGPDGFVVAGTYRGHPATWGSTDGRTWSRTDLPGSSADGPGRLRFTDGHFFLPVDGGSLWSGVDGRHWSKATLPGSEVGVFDVTAIPGGFVAVGRSSQGSQPGTVATADRALTGWTLKPADPVFDGGLAAALDVSPDGAYLVGVGMNLSDESVFLFADPGTLIRP